jgi:MoxR-like ATPase
MKRFESQDPAAAAAADWLVANRAHLDLHLARLRLLLERRVLWLRSRWKHDPLQGYAVAVITDAQADSHLQAESAEAESRFHLADPGARAIGERITEIEAQLAPAPESPAGSALETVTRLFRLTPFERDVLVLCLAPELDPAFELLYGYVQDDASRRHATPALALAVLVQGSEERARARRAFAPDGALRSFVLVELSAAGSGSFSTQPLRIDERMIHLLVGVSNEPDTTLARALRPMPDALLAPAQDELIERLASLASGGEPTGINLLGPAGSGRHAIATELARRLGLNLVELLPVSIPTGDAERREWIRRLEREAILLNLGFYLDADSLESQDGARAGLVHDLVETPRAFLVVGSRERYESNRPMACARVPRLDAEARRALWERATPERGATLDALVQQFEFGPHAIAQVARAAGDLHRMEGDTNRPGPDPSHLWRACREQAARPLQDLGRRIVTCFTWDDLVLPDDSAAQLREIAAQVANRTRVYEDWGFGPLLSRGRGISVLFAGPSGTGKTMAAEVLAQHLDLDLFRIDLSGVVSKYIGETEKNLRRVFDAAEESGAILFFDEADALFGKRSEVRDSHDRYANIEINYLLQRMEDYRGLAILATNMKSQLDPAFLRRLRFIVDIPFPDADTRLRIWQRAFTTSTPTESLDLVALSRLEITGGSIRNVALNAAFLAAATGSPVRMVHLWRAVRREFQKLEKILPASESGSRATRAQA